MSLKSFPIKPKRLSKKLMIALDVVRTVAAFLVVLQHIGPHHLPFLGLFNRLGQEAVIVFFILSGFVIYANEFYRMQNLQGYYLRRIRRIFPTLLLSLLVTTFVAILNNTFWEDFSLWELTGNLLALQDVGALKPGTIVAPYLGNDPLWSLSYEIFFYLIFPFIFRFWIKSPKSGSLIIGAACLLCYIAYSIIPNHWTLVASYFIIWWAGAEIAHAYLSGFSSWRSCPGLVFSLISISLTTLFVVFWKGYQGLGLYPFLMARHFIFATVFILIAFGPIGIWITPKLAIFGGTANFLSSISYGIYVFHYPLMVRWYGAQTLEGLFFGMMLTVLCAWVGDRTLNRFLPRPKINGANDP